MSSAPAPNNDPVQPPAPTRPGDTGTRSTDRIIVYRHSNMFYWWPIWVLGFVFAAITYFDGRYLAIVPGNTRAVEDVEVEVEPGKKEKRSVLILPGKKTHAKIKVGDGADEIVQPTIRVTHFRTLGSIYVGVLLLVIVITTISIRGLWTVLVFVSIIMLIIILAAGGWLGSIFHRIHDLSIFINMGGYLLISLVLFILWLVNFLVMDRQTYMIFTPGQVRIRVEIGGEETVYDTTGMVVQKERADLFRHWILGFGSGDLLVRPVGLGHAIDFPNVLRVGGIVKKVETMMKEKVILQSPEAKPPSV
ncbi:MAG: hypothetical protein HYX68_14540 [Planctomycetes bacterium]|nr:hypothetical protein [Planctomycetota bacterium]